MRRCTPSIRTDAPVRAGRKAASWNVPGPAYTLLLLAALGPVLSGCTAISQISMKQKAIPKADAKNPAVEILAVWQPAEGNGANGVPTRGFAGQILFFNRQHASPVQADGDVRVYLFDDRGSVAQQSKPIHQFDFQADAWKAHLQMSALGPSYHVFIPYVRKDQLQAKCALRVRLKPADAPVIYSEAANVVLPGPQPETNVADGDEDSEEHDALEHHDTQQLFDKDAARKLIADELGKNSAGSKRGARGRKTSSRTANAGNIGPNLAVAILEMVQDENGGPSARITAPATEWFADDDPAEAPDELPQAAAHPLQEATPAESPHKRIRLAPAGPSSSDAGVPKHPLQEITEEEDPFAGISLPAATKSRHPLEDEDQ